MKIAFFSESKTDEIVLKHLVEEIKKAEIEKADLPTNLRFRSSSHLVKNLPVVIRSVHYNSDANFLVIASDSDDYPVHIAQHDINENAQCHLCRLRKIVKESLAEIQSFEGKEMLKIAIGVPVPAIEAWLLFGINPHVSENTWIRKQNGEKIVFDRKILKAQLYGVNHISEEKRTQISLKAIERLIESELFDDLEKAFPQGFGSVSNEVKSWS
jgi:hypothetical protein